MRKRQNVSKIAVLAMVCTGQLMVPMMLTAVGVALPDLGRELSASARQLSLAVQLYSLTLAMTMLPFGRLGDLLGRRKVFLAGLAAFTLTTSALGFAWSIESFLVLRFFQGLGAAVLLPGTMSLLPSVFAPGERGRAVGLVTASACLGLTLGPVVGGYVTTYLGWRSVFWLAAPFGAASCLAGLVWVRGEWKDELGGSMDWAGSLILAGSIALLMVGTAHAVEVRTGPPMILAGMLLLVAFARLEARLKSPLLDVPSILANRYFSLSCLAAMGSYAATFGVTFFISLYLQYAKGFAPDHTGAVLLAQPLAQVFIAPLAGRLADRVAPARLANAGLTIASLGLLAGAWGIGADTPVWGTAIVLVLLGVGMGVFVAPNSLAILSSLPARQSGVASSMIGAMRTMGMTVSMTTATLLLTLYLGEEAVSLGNLDGFLAGMRLSLVAYAAFSALGLCVSFARGPQSGSRP